MRYILAALIVSAWGALLIPAAAKDGEPTTPMEALQNFHDFIGTWNGSGAPDRAKVATKEVWKETIDWSWRFKGKDVWLSMTVTNGKILKSGELRYLPDKKVYQLIATDTQGNKKTYEGTFKNGYLTLDWTDPATKAVQRITMNTAAEGIRFVYKTSHSTGGTLFTRDFQVAATKEGESLATAAKKAECVVSGGLGTSTVTYKGQTYYVCCSGCRDAFNEDPEKYIREFEAKKKAGK
ncbi:MAG: YHS domain-containing protein [Gemmataceae bacterium]|nr:YHS domain-containing protein [Gemmataceae bacterium]MDW8267486.1 YHS domain-containing protein [Gemmataceae bacterium]